jgi:hypothetical protein
MKRQFLATLAASGNSVPWLPKLDATCQAAFRGDLGVTVTGQGASAWVNQKNAAYIAQIEQATDARRPFYTGEFSRGRQQLYHYATDQKWMRFAAFAATQAQPWWAWWVGRIRGVNNTCPLAAGSAGLSSMQTLNATWPKAVRANAGSNLDSPNSLVQAQLQSICIINNGATDEIWVDNALVRSGSMGNNNWNGFTLGASGSLSLFFEGTCLEFCFGTGNPSANVASWYNNYVVPYYRLGSPAEPYFYLLPAGDSITEGFGSTNGDGWRYPWLFDLQKMQRIGGHWLTCVGNQNDGVYSENRKNTGFGRNIFDLNAALNTAVTGQLVTQPTDVLTVLIGGEDCANGGGATHTDPYIPYDGTPACTVGQWKTMIQASAALMTAGRPIVVMNLLAINPAQVSENANRVDFNAGMVIEVANMQGAGLNIIPVDARGALGAFDGAYYFDQRHPNDLGYERMWARTSPSPPAGWEPNIRAGLQAAGATLP